MYKHTDWPDRIYIEEENHSKYHELLSKADDDNVPFRSMKEIFMYSLILGFIRGEEKKIEKRKELIFEKYLDPKIDKTLIQYIYLLSQQDDESIVDKAGATEMAESYANMGFDELYDVVTKGHDMTISLTEFLMQNHLDF